jgi:hypothetical protein
VKIIGAEIRFGVQGYNATEAKVIPLAIEVPEELARQPFRMLECSVTIHTSEGDKTMNMAWQTNRTDYALQISEQQMAVLRDQFAKNVEAGS